MIEIPFHGYVLAGDPEATRAAYHSIPNGAPEGCGCQGCRNFIAVRAQVYPSEVLALYAQLGIDPAHEAEVYEIGPVEDGRVLYGGWHHFVGELRADVGSPVQVTEDFTLDFLPSRSLAAKSFQDQPVVQVEFTVWAPWVGLQNNCRKHTARRLS